MGAAIISRGDCVEFLLARGIPQHQSHVFAVHPVEQTMVRAVPRTGNTRVKLEIVVSIN